MLALNTARLLKEAPLYKLEITLLPFVGTAKIVEGENKKLLRLVRHILTTLDFEDAQERDERLKHVLALFDSIRVHHPHPYLIEYLHCLCQVPKKLLRVSAHH